MSNLKFIIKEHKENWYKIFKLSVYDFISPLRDTYLGPLWIVLTPMLQVGVYWTVFGFGIRNGRPVDGHPFIVWMLAGLVPWYYISGGISSGALSIYGKSSILTKMKFPTSIIPTYNTLTQLMNNIPVLIITMVIYALNGYKATVYYFQLIYYIIAASAIIISLTFLTSALVMAIRDINKIIGTVLRFLFYLTPILWIPSGSPKFVSYIIKFNPFTYIVNGFRNSMLYNKWFFEDINGTVYFWGVTLIIFTIGIAVHMKFRDKFSDLV